MSLRALKDLPQHTHDDDEDAGWPYDAAEDLIERDPDEVPLECTVYFNPEHPIANDLEGLERRLLAEIAPRYRSFDFQGFAEDDLRIFSPFSTRAAENRFLQRGYARGPGQWPAPEPAPRRTAGNRAHHLSYQESQDALQVLTLMTERALRTIRRLIPRRQRPAWLNGNIETILAPVCGRVSTNVFARAEAADDRAAAARDDIAMPDAAPIIPIVREGGLLLGCTDFERRRTVLPSHVSTPQSAAREGRAALKRWSEAGRCDLYADSATEQIKRELGDRAQHFGAEFDLAGAALWMCQCVMQMRLSVEEMRRRTAASWFAHEDKQEARWVENRRLLNRLRKGYGAPGENTIVALEAPTLARRILELFHGVAFDTWGNYDPRDPDDCALMDALSFVRWIRQLRLAGNATLNHSLALDICNFIEREDPYFIRLFSGRDGQQLDNLLGDMLPEAGWQALYDAACIVRDDEADLAFTVAYGWQGLTEHGPSGHVLRDERRVDIVGPLLMLPLHAADYWRDKARRIPAEGLYAYVE
jgi:hypothetical protein